MKTLVLILVLLDALFRVSVSASKGNTKISLNPCFTGCPFQGSTQLHEAFKKGDVLILVLLDALFRDPLISVLGLEKEMS